MRFRMPRPLRGWREFVHEIVIVVIGVLLALGGAQLIDTLRSPTRCNFGSEPTRKIAGAARLDEHDPHAGSACRQTQMKRHARLPIVADADARPFDAFLDGAAELLNKEVREQSRRRRKQGFGLAAMSGRVLLLYNTNTESVYA